jgi:hypothetical protein
MRGFSWNQGKNNGQGRCRKWEILMGNIMKLYFTNYYNSQASFLSTFTWHQTLPSMFRTEIRMLYETYRCEKMHTNSKYSSEHWDNLIFSLSCIWQYYNSKPLFTVCNRQNSIATDVDATLWYLHRNTEGSYCRTWLHFRQNVTISK